MPRRPRRTRERRRRLSETSKQADIEFKEREIADYQNSCFQGSAVVRLSDLSTGQGWWNLTNDGQNVARMTKILNIQGCLRLSREYHVPVVVDYQDWYSQVYFEEPTLVSGLGLPQLRTSRDYSFFALDHKSLITAAREKFKRMGVDEPWWVIDIYVADTNADIALKDELVRTLQESFSNEYRPPDGTIYRNIRFYQGVFTGVCNQVAEDYWWAVLDSEPGSRKGDYLRALHRDLRDSFDSLLPITGIWTGLNIGVLHKIKAMKCDEPIICYLEHIRQTFSNLVDGDLDLLSHIDASTVRLIRSRAPKVSAQDLSELEDEWNKGTLFSSIEDHQRGIIWERLKNIDLPIPTLETFFQDILYLEVGQTVMKHLCLSPPKGDTTIDKVLRSQYTEYSIAPVSAAYQERTTLPEKLCDLWRFSLQNGFELTSKRHHYRRVPRKQKDKSRAYQLGLIEIPTRDPLLLLQHFLSLAQSYGFEVPTGEGNHFTPPDLPQPLPCDFPPGDDDVDIERRCGKPFTDSINADLFALSRESLRSAWMDERVSAGFVRRCVFRAFFSYLNTTATSSPIQDLVELIEDQNGSIIQGTDSLVASGNLGLANSFSHETGNFEVLPTP
ncbi:uncharacterized protein N7496_006058, partial [Penicillium cataractarum]